MNEATTIRLPEWKHCVEQMIKEGIHAEKFYPVEYFEEHLRCKRGDNKFWSSMIEVQRALLDVNGVCWRLTQKGHNGAGWHVLDGDGNIARSASDEVSAMRALKRAEITLVNTAQDRLTEEGQRKKAIQLDRVQKRRALCARYKSIGKAMNGKLLKA